MIAQRRPAPKVIYSLWLQGEAEAPALVRLVFNRWAALNPGYELVILNDADVSAIIAKSGISAEHLTVQARSDIARIYLLLDGGIWTDATVLPTQGLNKWLPEALEGGDFFAFERPAPDRPLSSWFLACTPRHPLMITWWREVKRFWSRSRQVAYAGGPVVPPNPVGAVAPGFGAWEDEYPYFWLHYLFRYLLETDPDFADLWRRCVKRSATPSHALQYLFGREPQAPYERIVHVARGAPVHKLDWRARYPLDLLGDL